MAAIRIPLQLELNKILLADDEPEHLDWLIDFLAARGCETVLATTVRDAIEKAEQAAYRAYLIDLNIPLGGWVPTLKVTGQTYDDYHGLYILKLIRSQGNQGARVIAYSAHQNDAIAAAIKRLYCMYIVKGKPRELKDEIERLLSSTPRPLYRARPKRPVAPITRPHAKKRKTKSARFRQTSKKRMRK
jgi:CheY-like chemotaxis protein